jgi:hypothetical protein
MLESVRGGGTVADMNTNTTIKNIPFAVLGNTLRTDLPEPTECAIDPSGSNERIMRSEMLWLYEPVTALLVDIVIDGAHYAIWRGKDRYPHLVQAQEACDGALFGIPTTSGEFVPLGRTTAAGHGTKLAFEGGSVWIITTEHGAPAFARC